MAILQFPNDPLGTRALIGQGIAQQRKQADSLERLALDSILKSSAARSLASSGLTKQGLVGSQKLDLERLKQGTLKASDLQRATVAGARREGPGIENEESIARKANLLSAAGIDIPLGTTVTQENLRGQERKQGVRPGVAQALAASIAQEKGKKTVKTRFGVRDASGKETIIPSIFKEEVTEQSKTKTALKGLEGKEVIVQRADGTFNTGILVGSTLMNARSITAEEAKASGLPIVKSKK